MKKLNVLVTITYVLISHSAIAQNLLESTNSAIVFEFSEVVRVTPDPRERAVAFHSITFIDSIAHPISEIIFGTPEANALQGMGWFQNQTAAEIGKFQWAGGAAKQASMQLTIPDGTEGLLLKITSVKDSLWMNAKIDGELVATLRVDANWHSGYVPIGAAIPEPVSEAEPEWIEGQYFPHFPSTDRIYVLPARTVIDRIYPILPEWRINSSYETMMALTLVGMQGIINRNKPRVYLDYENLTGVSRYWVPYLEEHVEVIDLDLDHLSSVSFLLRRYASRFSGAVIYDPEVPETINLATMIAGLEDRIILAPEQLILPGMPSFASVTDLRQLVQQQGWDTTEESKYRIYQWVYQNLWQNLEHRIIGAISPGPPTSQSHGFGGFFPLGLAQRDYFIALKLSALWLDPRDSLQAELYGKFLKEAPSPIPITGPSPEEISSGTLTAIYGNCGVGTTALSMPITGNLTAFSGVRPGVKKYQPQFDASRILATLGEKPVAMIWSSDGDNMQVQLNRGFHGGPDWIWEKVQGQRFGWTTNPTLANLAPIIWNYYIDSRRDVEFVCGFSGAGNTYPRLMHETQLRAYLAKTATYLDLTGLRTVRVWSEGPWNKKLAQLYYDGLKDSGYLGAIANWGPPWGLHFSYEGVPAPAVRAVYVVEPSNLDPTIAQIASCQADSIRLDLSSYSAHRGSVVQDNETASGQAVLFSNSSGEYREIITGPHVNLAPGEYTATLRLKVSDNQSSQDFVNIDISSPIITGLSGEITGFTHFASQQIAPNAFEEPDKYKLINVPFTLDKLRTNIEIIVSHKGIYADLTGDYIAINRSAPAGLPLFIPIWVVVTSAERQTDTPRLFTEKFERIGGTVITPDEFVAVLNPKYMIDFATSILGAGHAAITQAQQQLNAGEYFYSLKTVRDALRQINGPKISLAFTSIDFDTVEIGDTQSKELVIGNNGTASLNVSDVTITNSDFKINPTAFSIPPVSSQDIAVRFAPSLHQVYSDTLVIHSNAIDNPIVKIPVSATGVFSQAPRIIAIKDVPADQGGRVRITFYPSRYDGSDATYQTSTYFVERQLENENWEAVGSFEAKQDSIYHFIAPTLGDSTANGIVWTNFRISAHTDSSGIFFISRPDSGYSVDNIAPNAPQGLAAQPTDEEILLTWHRNLEIDLQQYSVYRSTQANFDPATMATYTYAAADTFYLDEKVGRDTTYYYAISAFDRAGNESGFSSKVSAALVTEVADGDDPQIPKQYKLYQNYPNPFNAMTKIRFALPKGDEVKISVFDVKGNLVKEISKSNYKAGHHEVILNTAGFATGIYFYKIEAGKFAEVKKLVLIK